jgi:hypothetical protein
VYRFTNGDCYYYFDRPTETGIYSRVGEPDVTMLSVDCYSEFPKNRGGKDSVVPVTRRWVGQRKFEVLSHNRARTIAVLQRASSLVREQSKDWDARFLDVLESLDSEFAALEEKGRGESITRLYVVREVLRTATRGSARLSLAFGPVLDAIDQVALDPAGKWLDPMNPASQQNRIASDMAIKKMDTLLPTAIKQARESRKFTPVSPIVWFGWIRRDRDGHWMREPAFVLPSAATLVWMRGNPSEPSVIVMNPATGFENLAVEQADSLLEGMPLYVGY